LGNEVSYFEAAYSDRLPIMLKGPTGCGKTRFIEHMAYTLNKPLITVSCHEDMTATDLVGRYLLDADGTLLGLLEELGSDSRHRKCSRTLFGTIFKDDVIE